MTIVFAAMDSPYADEVHRGRGLRPREIRYVLRLYEPRPERRPDFEWLDMMKRTIQGADYIEVARSRLSGNPRQNLGFHLSQLRARGILKEKHRRYVVGPNFWSEVGPAAYREIVLDKIAAHRSRGLYSPGGVVTLVGADSLKRSGFQEEFRDEVVKRFEELAHWMQREYRIRARRRRDVQARENGPFFPLVLVDPNEIIAVEVNSRFARLETSRRRAAAQGKP